MACNCKIILSISILLITLLQLYFQYSSFMTNRNQHLEEKDKRKQLYTLNFVFGRRYEFNLAEIDTFFNENPLMKINALKNFVLNRCEKWNESREKKLNIKIYELFYLMIYDLIFIIFLYFFIFKFYPAGIVKIIMQILKFIFTAIRIKKINPAISIFNVICNHFDNRHLREVEIFDAEGFEIFEFLCNLVIIFDILYLILIIKDKRTPKKPDDNEIIVKKQILTDDNRVDYKDEENIELNEKKIYSNENNNESDEDSDKNNNSNNKDDDNENENENENDKNDEEINNNKYDGDDEDLNNNKNEDDDDQDNNCETNEINNNYNNKKDNEVINSINQENKNEENEEEEEGMNENQETY